MTTHDAAAERRSPGIRHFGRVNWLGLMTLYTKEIQRFMKIWGQTIAGPAVTSLLFLIIFNLAIGQYRPSVGGVSFAAFVAPGLVMMTVLQQAFANTSSSLLGSKIQGNLVDYLMPPLSPGELATGYALGGITRGVVVAFSTAVLIWPFARFGIHDPLAILFFAIGASSMLALLGLLTGVWAEKWDHMGTVTNFIIQPLSLLSGTFYSVSRLPEPWFQISHYNPFFYLIDGFRYGFTGNAESNLMVGVTMVIGLNLCLWVACHLVLRNGYKLKA